MVLPLLLAGAGATLGAIGSVGKAYDNIRYWRDYYKNTGYSAKYPWRAGQMDWLSYGGQALSGFGKGAYFGRRAYHKYQYYRRW